MRVVDKPTRDTYFMRAFINERQASTKLLLYLEEEKGLSIQNDLNMSTSKTVTDSRCCGIVVQMSRTLACHAGGRGFESHQFRQMV